MLYLPIKNFRRESIMEIALLFIVLVGIALSGHVKQTRINFYRGGGRGRRGYRGKK